MRKVHFNYSIFFCLSFTFPLVISNYPGASFAPPASPSNRAFPTPNSPGPMDIYGGSDQLGYVQATSPQPSGFPTLATVSRVSLLCALLQTLQKQKKKSLGSLLMLFACTAHGQLFDSPSSYSRLTIITQLIPLICLATACWSEWNGWTNEFFFFILIIFQKQP